ncbi:hypothetical protein [Streptomyces syringium]|uniref:hypothetical protein n=1 Tax=Streptomyces syringium TaxID=76729 RepID=UPI0033FF8563
MTVTTVRTEPQDTADTAAPPLTEYGTGLLRTTVLPLPDGTYEWRRAPGPLAPAPFVRLSPEAVARLADAAGRPAPGGVLLAPARPDGEARTYRVAGAESVAFVLLTSGVTPALHDPLRGLGRALRALHDTPPGELPAGRRSRGLDRLVTWLDGHTPSPRAAHAQAQVRRALGPDRWARVRGWAEEVTSDDQVVFAHGAAGLGSLVVGGPPGTAALLTGEDVCAAPWYVDLGWVVGELVELKWQLGGDPATWQSLIDALFDGYGRDLGTDWRKLAALRVLLHVHDIAAYLDDHQGGFDHYSSFLKFLTDL